MSFTSTNRALPLWAVVAYKNVPVFRALALALDQGAHGQALHVDVALAERGALRRQRADVAGLQPGAPDGASRGGQVAPAAKCPKTPERQRGECFQTRPPPGPGERISDP